MVKDSITERLSYTKSLDQTFRALFLSFNKLYTYNKTKVVLIKYKQK